MTQTELFAGQQRKREGMAQAAEHRKQILSFAKHIAYDLANDMNRVITIEDVRRYYKIYDMPWTLGNAAGSVFSGPEWEPCGWAVATHPAAHGRHIMKWRLKT